MLAARAERTWWAAVGAAAALSAAALLAVPMEMVPYFWLAVAGAVVFWLYALRGDLLAAVLAWFVTLVCLHEEFWRQRIPLFFAVTIPRLFIVVLVLLLAAMWLLGRVRVVTAWPLSGLMAALLAYFTISAAVTGFATRSPVTVHYRLIGGYVFPFTVFALILHGTRTERHLRMMMIFFALVGAYLTWTGWCEQFRLWGLVWPRFIRDPTVGIHWGRVRGPFVMSAAMGLALIYCYFNNLALARQAEGPARWALYALNAAMLPVVFWTKTRSVWLAMVASGVVWVAYSRYRTSRLVWTAALLTVGVAAGVLNIENFLSPDRSRGGLTDIEPIYVRLGLALMSWRMLMSNPLFGVGFGHFRDYGPAYATDPASPFYAFATTAMEHNNFLSILAETGIIGLALYVLVLVWLWKFSRRLYRKLPPTAPGYLNRDLLVLYWVLMMAYLTDGMLRETSDNPFANSLFFGLSGAIVAMERLLGPSRAGLEPLRVSATPPPPRRGRGDGNAGRVG